MRKFLKSITCYKFKLNALCKGIAFQHLLPASIYLSTYSIVYDPKNSIFEQVVEKNEYSQLLLCILVFHQYISYSGYVFQQYPPALMLQLLQDLITYWPRSVQRYRQTGTLESNNNWMNIPYDRYPGMPVCIILITEKIYFCDYTWKVLGSNPSSCLHSWVSDISVQQKGFLIDLLSGSESSSSPSL